MTRPFLPRAIAATILRGLVPQGCDLARLPPEGRREVTAALDAVLAAVEPSEHPNGSPRMLGQPSS